MTVASTLSFAAGFLLAALTVGLSFTFIIREAFYYCSNSLFPQNEKTGQTKQKEE